MPRCQALLGCLATVLAFAHCAAAQTASAPVMSDRAAARFLDQATWGPTPASIAQLQQQGIAAWLQAQIAAPQSDLPDQPIMTTATATTSAKLNRNLTPVQQAFFQNAVTGPDQLRQRVAFALSEIFVVSAVSTKDAYAFPPYWRVFRDNAFGNYRDIIKAITLSPAMGNYLSLANNNKANPKKDTSANENYARELMQLFTLGTVQLNMDGSPVLDSSGNSVPTYTQADVTQMAKVFTGWTYPTAPGATAKINNPAYYIGQMFAVESEHDTTAKQIFGNILISSGQTAVQDLDTVLDALMAQPTMAPFVSRQLIEHLVTSNPSPAYIERVANVFTQSGSGTRGDLQNVVTAILTDPEARAADESSAPANADFGHMREPVLFMTNLLRGLNATLGASSTIYNDANQLGQDLFYPPTVFSYFSPLNKLQTGLYAPEFQLYTTQTASTRANLVNTALYGTLDKSTTLDLSPFNQYGGDLSALVDYISLVFLHHGMPADLASAATTAANAAGSPKAAVQAALYVVLTSGEYQIVQ